uniref:Uncharacterized protein n=1 Tax=Hucho hucho TaxID=62062 RepID=A0A4W5QVR5_9TELE
QGSTQVSLVTVLWALQSIICCPMELAKTRMQLQGLGERKSKQKLYKNSLDCLVRIYRKEGFCGINRGMSDELMDTILVSSMKEVGGSVTSQ